MSTKNIIGIFLGVVFTLFLSIALFVYATARWVQSSVDTPDLDANTTLEDMPLDPIAVERSTRVIAELKLDDLNGKRVELPGKGRYRILNYWASWCGACVVELPALNQYAAQADETSPMLIGIALDDPEAISAYLDENPSKYPHFIEYYETRDSSSFLGNTSETIPYTILISPEGKLLKQQNGVFTSVEELKAFAKAP